MIYADNAATTKVSDKVLKAMMPCLTEQYGNPSSIYAFGQQAQKILSDARARIAACLGAQANEIYFTSGGSEADNWALKGMAQALARKGKKHIITTKIEHHAVLHVANRLEKEGFSVTYLDVHEDGLVRLEELKQAVGPDTGLVSVMYANNEIGTIQPIEDIGAFCRSQGIVFHTDAVQAVGHVPIDVAKQNIDLLSLSGHKIHAPKGIGVLYCRQGIRPDNLIDGGAQERGRRAGTENLPYIAGLATAMEEAICNMEEKEAYVRSLREHLVEGVLKIPRSRLNGHRHERLAGNANFCFEGIEGESLLMFLDLKGVCASSGSACTSGSLDPSHVLLAIGLPHEIAHGSLRISLSDENTMEEIDYILEVLPPIVERLRAMSPLWERISAQG